MVEIGCPILAIPEDPEADLCAAVMIATNAGASDRNGDLAAGGFAAKPQSGK